MYDEGEGYWRGSNDARLAMSERRLDELNGQIKGVHAELAKIRVEIARQGTKVAFGAGVAVLIAGPAVTFIATRLLL